jgi:hypothetical protein
MSRLSSVSQKTQQETSEALKNLHPYVSEDFVQNFSGKVDPHQVERAFGMRAVEKLGELANFPDLSKEGRATALRIIVAITVTQEEKQRAVNAGIIEACTTLLNDDDASVREHAGSAIASIALAQQSRANIAKAQTIAALCGAIADPVAEVRESASMALLNISISRRGADMIVATELAIEKIVTAIGDVSKYVSLYLVSCLVNSARYGKGVQLALNAGAVEKVISLLQTCPVTTDPKSVPGLLVQTLNAIWNLGNELEGKDLLIGADAVECISVTLFDPSTDVKRCATGALMTLSVQEYGKAQILDFSAVGLSRLLQDENESVRSNARTAIFQASENRDTRFGMVMELVQTWPGAPENSCELVIDVFGKIAAESLNKLLNDESEDVKERATLSLYNLATMEGDNGNNSVMSTLYIVEKLAGLIASARSTTREYAYKTLQLLLANHAYAKIRLREFQNDPVNVLIVNGEFGSKIGDLLKMCE